MKKLLLILTLLSFQLGLVQCKETLSCDPCAKDAYLICPGWVEDTQVKPKRETFYFKSFSDEEEMNEYAQKETKRLNAQETDGSVWKVTEIDHRIWRVSVLFTRFKKEN